MCTLLTLVLLAMFALPALAGDEKKAQDPAAAQQAMMAAVMPGEHHEHMKKLVGNFDYTIKMWMDPSQPPQESTGKRSAEMILGGRYLVEKFTGTFMGMPFEGIGTLAYDNVQKKYVSTWIDNMGTGVMTSTGSCDGKGAWNMSGDMADPMSGAMVKTRSVTKVVDDNTLVMEMYMPGADGKEFKMMEITARRSM
jgi:hypothetical protein